MEDMLVIYWSGTGNTEAMAEGIAKGAEQAGANALVFDVESADSELVEVYGKIAFGCPSMGVEVLEEEEFEPFFTSVEGLLKDKKVALFGSYDWGDGQWMEEWVERTQADGAKVMGEGFIVNLDPDEDECVQYGKDFAAF